MPNARIAKVFGPGRIDLVAVVAGLGLAFSLPPWGWWVLAPPAAGLLFIRLEGASPRRRMWTGWLAGLGCYVPGLLWVRSFSAPGAVVLIALEALFFALAALAVPARGRVVRAVAFPAAFVVAEWVRLQWPFGGLPLGGVFLGQAHSPLVGLARLGGPLLLEGAVYVLGVGLALVATSLQPDRSPRWRRVGALLLFAVLCLSLLAQWAPDGGPGTRALRVAIVQGGGRRGFRKAQIDPAIVYQAQVDETGVLERAKGPEPELVVWPEDVVSLDGPLDGSYAEEQLSATAQALRATLVVGVTETISATAFRNEAVAWGPDGTLVGRYEKVHRVPFGEYVPYRGLFAHLGNLSAVPRDAIPGAGTGLIRTPAGPLGIMVSFEVFYADRGRSAVRAGAHLLVVPTNTSSYSTAQVPTQEVAAAEIQAVEQGRDLLQAAPTGFSAVITNRGVLVARSTLGPPDLLLATVRLRTGTTAYVRFGDIPTLTLGLFGLASAWAITWRRRARRAAVADAQRGLPA